MNNSELDFILKKARAPERPEEFWAEFPQQTARHLNRARMEKHQQGQSWFPRLAWGYAAVACILAAFAAGHWRGRVDRVAASDVLDNVKLVRETLAMFPNQVRAIVQDERGLNLVLSQGENVPASAPLYVHICDGKQCASVVTFSGQEIQIAGQTMTVLSDVHGGIILEGNGFVWSSDGGNYAKTNLKIEARSLGGIL